MIDLLETSELEALVRTVEAGSVSRAAKELGIPRATLGRRLARLEERLGTRLLRRTTRSVRVTAAGEALLQHARIALLAVRDGVLAARRSDHVVRGLIRFASLPMESRSLDKLVIEFVRANPSVQIHVNVSARFVSFAEVDYDVALRAGDTVEQGLVSRRLLRSPTLAVASPAYLARAGTPRRLEDLAVHTCLLGFLRGTSPNHYWPLRAGSALRVEGALVTNDIHLLRRAVEQGIGIAHLPMLIAEEMLEAGTAVPVLEGIIGGETQIAVVYPEKAYLSPVVRAFIDAIVVWAKEEFAPRTHRAVRGDGLTSPKKPRAKAARRAGPRP